MTDTSTAEHVGSGSEHAAARGTHYIEEAVRVYLMRDPNGTDTWVVDPASFDEPLCSDYNQPLNPECRCGDSADCNRVRWRMAEVDLPDGEELMFLLAAARGYTVIKTES